MIRRQTDPVRLPLSLDEVKLHLRVDDDNEDALLFAYMRAETDWAETYCNRSLVTQTWNLYLDDWPEGDEIELPRPPLVASSTTYPITVAYSTLNTTSAYSQTLSTTAYLVDSDSEPGRIVLQENATWPTANLDVGNPIRVRYSAGYGTQGSDVPESIRTGILLNIGDRFENRENMPDVRLFSSRAAERLMAPYRVHTVP